MSCLQLCLLLTLLLPLALSEDCETALAAAQKEHRTVTAQLETEQKRVGELITVLQGKESDVELAKAALQEMENDVAQMDTEIKESRGREAKALDMIRELRATVKQLEEKNEVCNACQSDLDVSKGAEKQMEAELANAFARIQILAAESKQLTEMTDQLQAKVDEMEQSVTAANEKAATSESELEVLKERLAQSGQSASVVISETMNAVYSQLPDLHPYWQSVQDYVKPGIEAVSSVPALQQALDSGKKALKKGKEQASSLYSNAAPYVSDALDAGKTYGNIAIQKTNEAYTAMKPLITLGREMSKEYAKAGYKGLGKFAVQAMEVLRENSAAFYNSQFVADVKRVTSTTLEELQNYIQGQMWQIQSLQPFAKKEYVVFVVYTLLSLPPLFITGLLISCFSRSTKKQSPQTAAASATATVTQPARKKQAHKKSKKT